MENDALAGLLRAQFDDGSVEVMGEGGHIHVTVVSEQFAGLSRVARQQLVYGQLRELIASGEIHAVTMTTHTPAEHSEA